MSLARVMPARLTGLWRNADFLRLWFGQTVSEFGSVVTRDALPLVGVITLSATPAQIGVLAALGTLPALIIGLPAGAWVDRLRRRPIMIVTDLASAAVVLSVPIAYLLGALNVRQLYVVALLAGALALLFDVAYTAYLPSLIARENLVEGNSKLSASESVAEVGGSALAGALTQVFSAPMAMLIDAASFLVSALSVGLIRKPEPRPTRVAPPDLRGEIVEGLRALFGQPILRAVALEGVTSTFFGNFYAALYALYAIRELGISPALLGLLIASGGIGSFFGALAAGRLARRFSLGAVLIGSKVVDSALGLLTPLAGGPVALAATLLFVGQIGGDSLSTVYMIHSTSLRQAITPDAMLGRMNAGIEFLRGAVATAGVLVGGFLGEVLGLRPAVWVAALGPIVGLMWLIFSPVSSLRQMPRVAEGHGP